MIDSLSGNLLVASTLVHNPICANSVCLVVHHDDDGAIGVMLNRPMVPGAGNLITMLGGDQPSPSTRLTKRLSKNSNNDSKVVHFGGPLSGPVVAIHSNGQFADAETCPGIYVAAQKHHLEALVGNGGGPMRLIVGHFGWKPEQLQAELDSGVWHVLPATPEVVFTSDIDMWPRLIRRATAKSMASWIGASDNPSAWLKN
jgi:putative transcriptional regulator